MQSYLKLLNKMERLEGRGRDGEREGGKEVGGERDEGMRRKEGVCMQ